MPGNASVTYEIELLSFEDLPSLSSLPVSERLRQRCVLSFALYHGCTDANRTLH